MEISQHIKELLKTNERVILKGFGAFITKHIPARIDKETKVMKPPFKIVVFDQNITEDAGLLIKQMSDKEKLAVDTIREQIEEYVKTVRIKLDSGKKIEFKDLGEFSKKADGTIEFSYLSDDNLLLDAFGLPSVKIADQDQQQTKIPDRRKPIENKKPTKKVPQKNIVEKKPLEKKPVEKKKPVKEKQVRQKPVKQKPVRQKTVKQKSVKEGKAKKKRPVLLGLLIFLGAIGVFLITVYFARPDLWDKGYGFAKEKFTPVKSTIAGWFGSNDSGKYNVITNNNTENVDETIDTTAVEEALTDSAAIEEETDSTGFKVTEETTDENTEVEENIAENTVEENDNNTNVTINENTSEAIKGRYYIIVGSVKSESAAKGEQKRFSNKGIQTEIVYVPHMQRYRISIGNFASAKEAQNYFNDFQNKHGNIDAWVWEKR